MTFRNRCLPYVSDHENLFYLNLCLWCDKSRIARLSSGAGCLEMGSDILTKYTEHAMFIPHIVGESYSPKEYFSSKSSGCNLEMFTQRFAVADCKSLGACLTIYGN